MSNSSFSGGVLAGLEIRLKHPPPYSDRELDGVEHIQVIEDQQPGGLERLEALSQITYRGCEVVDLEVLKHLPSMRWLNSWSSNLTSVARLPVLAPRLTEFECVVGQLRDLRPLLDLPLRRAAVAGNPIDEESFRHVYPELLRRSGHPMGAGGPVRSYEFLVHEREWELMQLSFARGLRLSAYQVGGRTRIAAPGHLVSKKPELFGVDISVRQARKILEENRAIDEKAFFEVAKRVVRAERYVE